MLMPLYYCIYFLHVCCCVHDNVRIFVVSLCINVLFMLVHIYVYPCMHFGLCMYIHMFRCICACGCTYFGLYVLRNVQA